MDKKDINRINELAHKQKREGLTPEESAEQKELRERFLEDFRKRFKAQLDCIEIVEANGDSKAKRKSGAN